MSGGTWSPFASKHLDPGSRMSEVLFGLIMTTTFTLGAGVVVQEEGAEGARLILIGVLGCNLAWGIIDGVFYVLGQVFERGRLRRVALHICEAATPADSQALVAGELDDALANLTDEAERNRLYSSIAQRLRGAAPGTVRVRREDFLGGLASGWLVFACSIPAILPFLVLDEPHTAMRVSNAILLSLLFLVGYRAARFTTAKPWLTGVVFLLFGLVLVVMAIALGG